MKAYYFLIPFIMINACKTQTAPPISSENKTMEQTQKKNKDCPADGICTVEVTKNKTMLIKVDDLGGIYPEIEDGKNMLVEYTFTRKGPEGTVDGNYTEKIYFEVSPLITSLSKDGPALQDVKLMYEKQCYCKGEAGFYKITDGKLDVKQSNGKLSFDLTFNVGKTSQVVSVISRTVAL